MNNLLLTTKLNNSSDYDSSGPKSIEARYLQKPKKKYQLAGIDTNVEKLREDQVQELTKFLIGLKSEYDELIRDTLKNKKDTEVIAKQIEMLEKIDKKKNDKHTEAEAHLAEIKRQIEIKQVKMEEEVYQRDTMNQMIERMREENLSLQKKINVNEIDLKRNQKELHKQKLKTTEIKEKLNQIHVKTESQKMKNVYDKNEHFLVTQYYKAVINNKWSFIDASDERKEKQKKIAQEAKNDTQDKQEVEKRKQYFLLRLFNKYLKRKIEKETKDNEQLERTFQRVKNITGMSNVKNIVEKIGNKDKDYNHCVAKVNDKETKISILRDQIKKLNEDYIRLRNEASVDVNENQLKEEQKKYDAEEQELVAQERQLQDELEELITKNTNVELTYEKVMENMKFFISKTDKLQKGIDENSFDSTKIEKSYSTEEEVYKGYNKFLSLLKGTVDKTFSKMTKEEFIWLMKEKALEINKKNENVKSQKRTTMKNQTVKGKMRTAREEDDMEEMEEEDAGDMEINEEFKDVIRGQQRAAAAEKLRQEKEKELEKKK